MTTFVVMSLIILILIGVTITTISVIIKRDENYRIKKICNETYKKFDKKMRKAGIIREEKGES